MPKHTAQTAREKGKAPSEPKPGPRAKVARIEPRRRTMLREGRILDLDRVLISDCLFFDISPHGACVMLPADVPIPLNLFIFDGRSRNTYPAEFRWRKNCYIGLFISAGIIP